MKIKKVSEPERVFLFCVNNYSIITRNSNELYTFVLGKIKT